MLSASLLLQHHQRLSTVSSVAPLLLKAFRKKKRKKFWAPLLRKGYFFIVRKEIFLSFSVCVSSTKPLSVQGGVSFPAVARRGLRYGGCDTVIYRRNKGKAKHLRRCFSRFRAHCYCASIRSSLCLFMEN